MRVGGIAVRSYQDIFDIAAERKGGAEALEALIAEWPAKSRQEIAATPDDRFLAAMTRFIFIAGFRWRVVEQKWPGFEAAFWGFDVHRCAMISDDGTDVLLGDVRIVRNGAKVASVRANAQFLKELADEHGSAARFFADWPDQDYVGLLDLLKRRAARLSGETAMRFLRTVGKPSFITTRDVGQALIDAGVLERPPSGKRDLALVQAAFNRWAEESGRDFTAISRTLALSTGEPPPWARAGR